MAFDAEKDGEEWYETHTTEVDGEDVWVADMTEEEFVSTVQVMGWDDAADFEAETGVTFNDIAGKAWMVCGDPIRVFLY